MFHVNTNAASESQPVKRTNNAAARPQTQTRGTTASNLPLEMKDEVSEYIAVEELMAMYYIKLDGDAIILHNGDSPMVFNEDDSGRNERLMAALTLTHSTIILENVCPETETNLKELIIQAQKRYGHMPRIVRRFHTEELECKAATCHSIVGERVDLPDLE